MRAQFVQVCVCPCVPVFVCQAESTVGHNKCQSSAVTPFSPFSHLPPPTFTFPTFPSFLRKSQLPTQRALRLPNFRCQFALSHYVRLYDIN